MEGQRKNPKMLLEQIIVIIVIIGCGWGIIIDWMDHL